VCRSVLGGNRDDQAGERRACSDLSKYATRNLLFGGQTVSVIGDALSAVARPRLILSNGDNAEALGIVLTTYGIPRAGSMRLGRLALGSPAPAASSQTSLVRPILFPCGGLQASPGDGVWHDPKSVERNLASVLGAMKQLETLIAPGSILNATTFSREAQELYVVYVVVSLKKESS
jgi:hypothetical protein